MRSQCSHTIDSVLFERTSRGQKNCKENDGKLILIERNRDRETETENIFFHKQTIGKKSKNYFHAVFFIFKKFYHKKRVNE